jgi:hypothetical protein
MQMKVEPVKRKRNVGRQQQRKWVKQKVISGVLIPIVERDEQSS